MARRQFTVNVPSLGNASGEATLQLEPVTESELTASGLDLPVERLEIRSARLSSKASSTTLAGCLGVVWDAVVAILSWLFRRPIARRRPTLKIQLDPRSAADVRISIDVGGTKGAAAMHLVDRRGGKVVGGVTLLVVEGAMQSPSGTIPAPNPCPMTFVDDPFWIPLGAAPDSPRYPGPIPSGFDVDLLAWIKNGTEEPLADATAYLEHLGGAAEFQPSTWNLGEFEPGATFPLRWRLHPRAGTSGTWDASIVVAAKGFDPTRLRPTLSFGSLDAVDAVPVDIAAAEPA